MNEQREVLTAKEAAAMPLVSSAMIRRWCRLGYIDAFQVGRGAASPDPSR